MPVTIASKRDKPPPDFAEASTMSRRIGALGAWFRYAWNDHRGVTAIAAVGGCLAAGILALAIFSERPDRAPHTATDRVVSSARATPTSSEPTTAATSQPTPTELAPSEPTRAIPTAAPQISSAANPEASQASNSFSATSAWEVCQQQRQDWATRQMQAESEAIIVESSANPASTRSVLEAKIRASEIRRQALQDRLPPC